LKAWKMIFKQEIMNVLKQDGNKEILIKEYLRFHFSLQSFI